MIPALRVLHVYSGNLYGGIETFLVTLARLASLAPGMHSEFALCFDGRLKQELEATGAPLHDLSEVRTRAPWTIVRARKRLAEVIRKGAFDAVVCHSPWAQAIFGEVPRTVGVPGVFWLHEAIGGRHWLERWCRRTHPTFCVANSHFSMSTLGLLFRDLPAAVLYCPVELAPARLGPDERRAIRRELGADDETTVITQIGRMHPLKGHARLLRTLARLRTTGRFVCAEIGGPQRPEEQRYFDDLHAMTRSLGVEERVRFLGQRADVAKLIAASDVYCQPNTHPDSFGIVLIEALAAGLPIVAADLGGPREIVSPEVGFLVGDDESLARALEELVQSSTLRRTLGAEGPARARELCDPTLRLPEIERVLRAATHSAKMSAA